MTVNADTTVGVSFAKPTLAISPKPSNGYVAGNGLSCGSGSGRTACSVTLNSGTRISLTATANSGYDFSRWSGGCSGTSSSCAFTLMADTTVGTAFEVEPNYTYVLEAIYFLASAKPDKPTGGTHTYLHTPPGGWTRTQPTPTLSKAVYRSQRTATYLNGGFLSATAWSDVEKDKYWSRKTEYIYKLSTARPLAPSGGTRTANHTPSGWQRAIPEPTLTQPVWRAERTVTLEHTLRFGGFYSEGFHSATIWRNVVKHCHLTQSTAYIYKRSATPPSPPSGEQPAGWSTDETLEPTLTEPVWRAQRTVTYKHCSGSSSRQPATAWSNVVKYKYLDREQDHIYKLSSSSPPPQPPHPAARTTKATRRAAGLGQSQRRRCPCRCGGRNGCANSCTPCRAMAPTRRNSNPQQHGAA